MSDGSVLALPSAEAALARARRGRGYWKSVWARLREDKITIAVIVVLVAIILSAVLAPLLTPHDPLTTSVLKRLKPIGTEGHWLGTDEIGRDLWARMVYGGRLSLLCGVLPVVTLSLIPMGVVSRLVRANVLEILSQEFVGSLHAKGLRERRVLTHVMKNAAPSALALMGLQFGYLLGGSILVETVYNWPGSGGLLNLAIFRRDIPVLSGTIVAIAAIFVVINIVVDVLQALIDPRIRR